MHMHVTYLSVSSFSQVGRTILETSSLPINKYIYIYICMHINMYKSRRVNPIYIYDLPLIFFFFVS